MDQLGTNSIDVQIIHDYEFQQASKMIHKRVSESPKIYPSMPREIVETTPLNKETQTDPNIASSPDVYTRTTLRKYRSLVELYETCGFSLHIADPIIFVEAQR